MKAALMNDEVNISQLYTNALLEGDSFYKSLFNKLPIAPLHL